MRNFALWTAAFALLDCTNFANAQDSADDQPPADGYYYEWLRIDATDPTAISYSEGTITPSSGGFGSNMQNFASVFSGDKTWAIMGFDGSGFDGTIGVLHEETLEFEEITTTGAAISLRQYLGAAANSNGVYIFGGQDTTGNLNELLFIDSTNYTVTDITGTGGPAERSLPSLSRYGDDFIVFGGVGSDGAPLDDLWKYTTADSTWSQLTPTNSVSVARMSHCAAVLGDKLYIFGESGETDGNMYSYDFTTNEWATLALNLTPTRLCSIIPSYQYDADDVASEYLYVIHQQSYEITKVDLAAETSEVVKAGTPATYVYGQSVLYEPDAFLTFSTNGVDTATINDFAISPMWESPVDDTGDEEEEEGFFSSPAGIALIAAIGAAAVGAAVYFLVLKP